MSADLNRSLEECESQAKALVQEMRQYKAARELNQRATEALEKASAALNRVTAEIKPLTERRIRRFMTIQIVVWSLLCLFVVGLCALAIWYKR